VNAFYFAMKMELDGKAYYEKMAEDTRLPGLKTLFMMLANDEQKHFETIRAIQTGAHSTMADSTILDGARNVFFDLKAENTILDGMDKGLAACMHAMKIEEDSERLYLDMAAKETNPDLAGIMLRLANEEKKHFIVLENLYDFTLRPKYFFDWQEFNNPERL